MDFTIMIFANKNKMLCSYAFDGHFTGQSHCLFWGGHIMSWHGTRLFGGYYCVLFWNYGDFFRW